MAKQIVVGVNTFEYKPDAFNLGIDLARVTGAPLLLVSVFPPHLELPFLKPAEHDTYVEEIEIELNKLVSEVPAEVEASIRTIASRSPARGLHAIAEEEDTAAVVVGSSHHGVIGTVVLGNVGRRLLHGSPCPVAVAPAGYKSAAQTWKAVGVAWTDSPEANAALATAAAVARRTEATLRVITINQPLTYAGAHFPPGMVGNVDPEWAAERHKEYEQLSAQAIAALPEDLSVTTIVIDGMPIDELRAESEDLDLLVCGSRAYGPLGNVLLGSVSGQLMREAACPLLITPRGSTNRFDKLLD